jgi:hypothetical protein
MTGILRTHGKPKVKARALMPEELARIHDYLKHENTFAAARDDALLQIGFFGAFRRSKLLRSSMSILDGIKQGLKFCYQHQKQTKRIQDNIVRFRMSMKCSALFTH